ncbi:unnamed protein product [Absidia cylindrospora]
MLFTSSSKISQILEEIDTARCKGRWKAIPNLARRYVKYNPEGTGLEQLVLAEATLVQLGQTKKTWDSKEVQPIQISCKPSLNSLTTRLKNTKR